MWTKLKRVFRAGFLNFLRNGFVSLSSILVLVVTLYVISSVVFAGAILRSTLEQIRDKVDINVYFVTTATESDILTIKKNLEKLPEVEIITYTTKEEVLDNFKKKHENDEFTVQALDELGENPFGSTLNIKAKDPSQYETITQFLNSRQTLGSDGTPIVDNINYYKNKDAIDSLTRILKSANKLGLVLTIVLIVISVLITFNTIRLVIFMSRDEISVMRLVGASTGYIRGPFFVAGGIYGFVAAVTTLVILYPVTLWLGRTTEDFFGGFNVFHYYTTNFGQIFLLIILSGIIIGSFSSFLAVRKHLIV